MTTVLFWTTVALDVSGILFAVIYLLINHLEGFTDLESRNAGVLKTARISMILSLVGAFVSSLLASVEQMEAALATSALLYSIIAVSWVSVLLACGIILLISVVSKRHYRTTVGPMLRKLVKIAVPGSICGLLLAWLFS